MGLVAVLLSPRAMVYKLQLSIYDSYICKKENIKAVKVNCFYTFVCLQNRIIGQYFSLKDFNDIT